MKKIFCIISTLFITFTSSLYADLVPDPDLQQLVKTTLNLHENVTVTEAHLKSLTQLIQGDSDIRSLAGLEYAANLTQLEIYGSHITDLSPIRECVGLTRLGIAWNKTKLKDISAVAKLINLEYLDMSANYIKSIEHLGNLKNLVVLKLELNIISDLSSLSMLPNLVYLDVRRNPVIDVSPVTHILEFLPKLADCELSKKPVEIRLADKNRPSIFAAFTLGGWSSDFHLSQTYERGLTRLGSYGLYFMGVNYLENSDGSWRPEIDEQISKQLRDVQTNNDNMVFLAGILMRAANFRDLPENYPYWLRDQNGNRINTKEGFNAHFLDFSQKGMQQDIIQQATAVADCGLFDGIFFDWWHENGVILADRTTTWGTGDNDGYIGFTAEQTARDNILKGIRENVPEDFLILVNTNRNKIYRTAWGINGTFMETGRDVHLGFPDDYTHVGIKDIEDTLRWSEKNMRYPQINCLEGAGHPKELHDSYDNQRNMRLFTTMHLTHSDGFILYPSGYHHDYIWYPFWNINLGKSVSEKSVSYENTDGLFIREFDSGYAVYNRSGSPQKVYLPMSKGVESGVEGQYHSIPDLDGEIYLKSDSKPKPDINNDGTVNILDLVIIANRFGKSQPDITGDGIVNILDIVFVVNEF